jgi:hypothetical protein
VFYFPVPIINIMSTQKIKKIIKKFPGKYLPGNRALRSISRTIVRVVYRASAGVARGAGGGEDAG